MNFTILRSAARARPVPPWDDDRPIRQELFSVERLEQHAESLAASQPVAEKARRVVPLVARLVDNERALLDSYRAIAAAVGDGRPVSPAAEWLLDNYHIVEEQVREVRADLPSGYYRQLPKLREGPFAGYPRVFGLAWAFVAHTDSRFDPDLLCRFVRAYQNIQPLTIGELWAVAITLRIVLIENLRRAAQRIVSRRSARDKADAAVDLLLGVNGKSADPAALAPYERDTMPEGFAVQLVQRLRDQDPDQTPALRWLEERLAAQGTTADDLVHDELQRQGATNVTVRNIITSMRLISDVDWADLFEKVSRVDEVLRGDGRFAEMDFATRNLYRTAIERIARRSPLSELEIARAAVDAAAARAGGDDARWNDPGYHLVGGGRAAFESRVGCFGYPLSLGRLFATAGIAGYVGSIALVYAAVLLASLFALAAAGVHGTTLGAFTIVGLLPAIDVAITIVNRWLTTSVGATVLPGLALRDGVPAELRTLVVVPVLLTTRAALDEQIDRLEEHYLANPGGEVHFALLSDWADAPTESAEGDSDLLEAAAAGVARLNKRYEPMPASDRFVLLHRRRVWSAGQGTWMGWERKRGKLHELNRLLRGAVDTTYIGAAVVPGGVRYVVTLDSDTRLPRDAIRKLVGKMAHPLNRPRIDGAEKRVVEGYGVLQPRVTPSLPVGREGSVFQRAFSSNSGIDPYASAVSDVYQDLFGEGSYSGKGIYDVDAFEAALDKRVPENAMLSHDLFEGVFARSGLVTDIEVVEEYPARYIAAAARQHRWARGDWQLLPWILGRSVDGSGRDRGQGHMPAIGFWKMFDNLRRSLSAPAAVAALLAGWTLPTAGAVVWTGFVLLSVAMPALLPILSSLTPRHAGVGLRGHLSTLRDDLDLAAAQTGLLVVFLAHQAWLMLDAIGRTLFRLLVSHRNLLDWVTATQAGLAARADLAGVFRNMSGGVAVGLGSGVFVAIAGGEAWFVAAPFIVAWIAAPAIAHWASLSPLDAADLTVSPADAGALRLIARRTWRFFETYVTAADNMLPPDNFQEDPRPVVAHRTSPTNIGLYLLSTVSARDFGWIGGVEAVERIEATLATMRKLERFRGHFYNWYDTTDLRPLDPRYVSSVDSGNLAGHLVALAQACRGWMTGAPADAGRILHGIHDALRLARGELEGLADDRRTHAVTRAEIAVEIGALCALSERETGPDAGAAAALEALLPRLGLASDLVRTFAGERGDDRGAQLLFWVDAARRCADSHHRDAGAVDSSFTGRLESIETAARDMAVGMEFGFLLNVDRRLLSIGYAVAEDRLDPSCYDLLASEARLASFIAIAKGDVPTRHWFRLGRAVTPVDNGAALISWSGSMFEYLMPSLVVRAPLGSLVERTNLLVVRRQIAYATGLGLPWGISESAYNARDRELTYQYSNFGVPGLGFKRGLSENAVVAPYATGLAAMVDPAAASANFARLAAAGALGTYGFYEALDYTPARLPEGRDVAIVRAYMAHHQGMTIVAIGNALLDGAMRTRFHAEPIVRATELLLQERTPREVALAHPRAEEVGTLASVDDLEPAVLRRFRSPHGPRPSAHLLSNGRYSVMLTTAGSGYSRWRDIGVTRWREDSTRDDWGSYVYLRDAETGGVWSATYQPTGVEPDTCDIVFAEDRAEFSRRDGTLTTTLDIVVSPEDDAEVRRVCISNSGTRTRTIELTSYAEVALAAPLADAAHPAFSKMFVQTEFFAEAGAILATRRRRVPGEPEIWAAHLAVVEGETVGEVEIETDRALFLGRGRDAQAPVSVMDGRGLSNTVGAVLDPVFALRRRVRIPAGGTARVAFWTMAAASRADVLSAIDRHHDVNAYERAVTLAWTHAQVQLRHLDIESGHAATYQRLAGHVLYAGAAMRPPSDSIRRGAGGQPALWTQGISGDLPIVLARIDEIDDIGVVRELLRAHEYWRLKGLEVDLVILNERGASYVQDLQIALEALVRTSRSRTHLGTGTPGSVFILRADLISSETRALLPAVARAVLLGRRGTLWDQLERIQAVAPARSAPRRKPLVERAAPAGPQPQVAALASLQFFNGLGGFSPDGREYVTVLGPGRSTPAPWINVVANPSFGFQVATEGSGYTWSLNSRDNQLTPWSNDPVSDRSGECIYIRDEESGELWGPTAAPIRRPAANYIARHGRGYSKFEHFSNGIALELTQFVPVEDPVKISRLTICNLDRRSRKLSVTAFVEWTLGLSRGASAPHIVTELDEPTGAILARNPWNSQHGARVAFADLGGRQTGWTADRCEFLGRNGTADNPAALADSAPLSRRAGAGVDPCAALQAVVELAPGGVTEIIFLLGEAADPGEARALMRRYRAADLRAVYRSVIERWDEILGVTQVTTPDPSMDIMLNGWLLYQTLACRYWARSAFYQASGAYGFRDQLQDTMSLALARPALTREHILRAAARQFIEGDVQHWWFPPAGQGVRTRISDDRVWLSYATAHYITVTGDRSILDERVPFLEGPALRPGDHDSYFTPAIADESASLFEHCARGLDLALPVGPHGLPLIGTGDWNDGMNRVGDHGRGESVWLGWFLHTTLAAFAPVAEACGNPERAAAWRAHMEALATALDAAGWDGGWYRRGYYDDGTPLGSSTSEECRIDSIAQSWAAISGAADPERAARAMGALDEHLTRRNERLSLLFTPPFDRTELDPGYIKGYPPGIRENGGQYTHAAAWAIMGFAALGDGDKAAELFALVNPINHAATRAGANRYKVEPYVAAADVYSVAPHAGRGGWTWYTGSAGWLHRAGLESILGVRVHGDILRIDPVIPLGWPGFGVVLKHHGETYEITVENPVGVSRGVVRIEVDGVALDDPGAGVPLTQGDGIHKVRVVLG